MLFVILFSALNLQHRHIVAVVRQSVRAAKISRIWEAWACRWTTMMNSKSQCLHIVRLGRRTFLYMLAVILIICWLKAAQPSIGRWIPPASQFL